MAKPSEAARNLRPIFVKANVKFELKGRIYGFDGEGISVFGVSNLPSQGFDPMDYVGEQVPVTVDVMVTNPFQFKSTATLTAEATVNNLYLGLKFNLGDKIRQHLATAIRNEGFYPTSYIRKYPRIPASDSIPNMPIRCIVATEDEDFIAFDIADMSPNGILLHTENPKASLLIPGLRIAGQIEPRGQNLAHVDFIGLICRMMLVRNPLNQNIKRYLGVKLNYVPEDQRVHFLEILRTVIDNIQSLNQKSAGP